MPLSGEEEGEQVSLSCGTLAKNNRNKDVVCMIEGDKCHGKCRVWRHQDASGMSGHRF